MNSSGDPISVVDEILRFNEGRKPQLLEIKFARMAENAFAFFRGTDHLFATRWSSFCPADLGPAVLLCGDLHVENFGAYETDDGDFRYDINDFDEALVAPCSVDLVRVTTSILLAAEAWQIPAAAADDITRDFLAAYRAAIAETARSGTPGAVVLGQGSGPIWDLLGQTASGDPEKLLDHHTECKHGERHIKRSADKHPDVSEKTAQLVRKAIEGYGQSTATPAAFRVLDVTRRIMGIGSLGVRRYTVLVAGGGTTATNRLLDVKEALPSSVLACAAGPQPDWGGNEALRVVQAQRQLQSKPIAGLATVAIDGRNFRLRLMVPDENRSKLDRLQNEPAKLRSAVAVVGRLTAWSHWRGCAARGPDVEPALAAFAAGASLDAVSACAVRCAAVTNRDFWSFREAFEQGRFGKHAHD